MRLFRSPFLFTGLLIGCSLFVILDMPDTPVALTSSTLLSARYDPVLVDGNLTLDFQDGNVRSFWVVGREANFTISTRLHSPQSGIEVMAGIDPCGRQTQFEMSIAGSPPIMLGASEKSVVVQLVTPNIHVHMLSPVCLIQSDPRIFYGQVQIKLPTRLVPFDFSREKNS